jgi:hypothetical protein
MQMWPIGDRHEFDRNTQPHSRKHMAAFVKGAAAL